MTLRTKSKGQQRMAWLCAALVILAVYVVLSHGLYNAVGWSPLDYRCHRLMLPLVVLFVFVAWETRWDGVVRRGNRKEEVGNRGKEIGKRKEERGNRKEDGGKRGKEVGNREEEGENVECRMKNVECRKRKAEVGTSEGRTLGEQSPHHQSKDSTADLSGEELYQKARTVPHQPIPDFVVDGAYLKLLGKSVEAGYAPAMTKLGEYAMRRAAWVEAYYWMTRARRNGMHGLSPMLREIRQNWAMAGFPNQSSNVSELFSIEAGSLGRALLHLDSGHEAAVAREFLKANFPDYLT